MYQIENDAPITEYSERTLDLIADAKNGGIPDGAAEALDARDQIRDDVGQDVRPNMGLGVPKAVSYTHLDVYKRQGLARAKPRSQAPVNGGRNYNGPKVAKFLVG